MFISGRVTNRYKNVHKYIMGLKKNYFIEIVNIVNVNSL